MSEENEHRRELLAKYVLKKKMLNTRFYSTEELVITPEFKVLELLNDKSLALDEIKSKFDLNHYLTLLLSKLESSELIIKTDDRWGINETLLKTLSDEKKDEKLPVHEKKDLEPKEKVIDNAKSSKEMDAILGDFDKPRSKIKTRIRSELLDKSAASKKSKEEEISSTDIDDLFDDVLEMPMEDFIKDFSVIQVVEDESGKPILGGPIIDILKEQGYIKENLTTENELQEVPEYEILSIIVQEHPIPLDKIEEKVTSGSISLVLSNLQADDLISQTNDYRWTISKKVGNILTEFLQKQGIKYKVEETQNEIDQLRSLIDRDAKDEEQFIKAMHKLGYIISTDLPLTRIMQTPEVKILKIIKDNEPISNADIKQGAGDIPPVQVMRMISRLDADGRILQNIDADWELTFEFIKILVENVSE